MRALVKMIWPLLILKEKTLTLGDLLISFWTNFSRADYIPFGILWLSAEQDSWELMDFDSLQSCFM